MTTTELKQWRTSRHLTQSQAAALVGAKSYRTWQAWERGQNGIPRWIPKMLELLNNKYKL
jgi:DNA-binding transcriptional regulator YiaG